MSAAPALDAPPAALRPRTLVVLALAASAASLILQRTPDFDPTAWLIWGRQIADGTLITLGGPSWKPLPVLFTTPFSLAGDTVAPWLWLVVARTGGILAVVMAYRLAARLGGRTAGRLAAAALVLATDFLYNAFRGDSEGLLVLATLGAVDLHLRGRRHAALLAGLAGGLIRPELWPLLAAYGAWLLWRERRAATALLLAGSVALLAAAWFIPEHIGSGDWWRAATRAQNPVPGSPGQSSLPFLVTFLNASIALALPVYLGAIRAVAAAWRTRAQDADGGARVVLALAAGATAYMLVIAALAERGFTGNLRYVTVPAALLCVLAGLGLPRLWQESRAALARRRVLVWLAAGLCGLSVLFSAALLVRNGFELAESGRVYGRELPELIERAGGAARIRACGPLGVSHFERQAVAWQLHVAPRDVRTGIALTARTAFGRRGTGAAKEGRAPVVLELGDWVLRSDCPLGAR
jgi:hypothetical protein